MKMFALSPRSIEDRAKRVSLAMKSDRYLRLRREAAGLSIDQVAARLAPRPTDRAEAANLIRALETPGRRALYRETIYRLAAIIPLDADVYHQLATEPADRHPHVCRTCGCSQNDPCHGPLGICSIVLPGICSRCIGAHAAELGNL